MPDIGKIILRSGPCLDSPAFLRFYLRALENPVLRLLLLALRIKFSPAVLDAVRHSPLPPAEKGELFSAAMNLFRGGGAFKTTRAGRSPLTDAAVLGRAAPGALIVEAGVSDGVSALHLLANSGGAEVLLTDLQASFPYRNAGPARVFYYTDGAYISVKLPLFYLCTGLRAGALPPGLPEVSLLNPLVAEKFPAARLAAFDIFSGAPPRRADVIKCANVLNLAYFTPDRLRAALENLCGALNEGGWLVIGQNNPAYEGGEAWLALQRQGNRLLLRQEAHGHELLPLLRSPGFSGLVG